MSFLNLALVAGVLAFNVPLIIHLLNKSRYKQIDWAAMFLLEQVVRQNRKRVRLEQIIMLLVRCAIPVLLALAMAQPILTGFQKLVGSAPGSTVVMLDASYSMQAKDGGAQSESRFDIARAQARGVLDASPTSSQAQVVRVGGGFDPVTQTLTPELDRVGKQLDKLDADRAVADGPAALRRGIATLTDATTAKRDLVLISDFQRVSWAEDSGVQRDRLKQMIDAMPVKPAIVLMPVASEVGRNLSITDVTLSSRAIGVGQRVRVSATVLNTSDQDAPDTPVVLSVDGVELETQRLSIDAGESADLVFFHKFDEGGPHTLEVSLTDGVLAADDAYRVAVNVIASLPVTLVSGDRDGKVRPRPFPENETDFLEVALEPFAASTDAPLADLIDATVIGPQALDSEAIEGQRVVVLANVQAISDEQVKLLRAFVEAGGALLVFPGDRVDVENFNKQLHALGRGLSPASIAGVAGKGLGFDDGAMILDERHEHPALALWNDPANGALGTAQLDAWYRLQPDRDAQTIARLTTGHPFLVRHELDEGVVIVGAASIDTGWGNLPTTPVYLPLMQRLIAFAATHAEPASNVMAGKPLTALLDAEPNDESLVWQLPDGSKTRRRVEQQGGRWACTLDRTDRPGYYRLLIDDEPVRVFAVNLPREESDLRRLSDDELEQLADAIGATIVDDAEAYAAYDQTRRHGRPVWRVMWVLLLALVFGEMLLQQWFGKGGRS
ncbi:MAG: BatA domain-containing protein [Phycisphaeraceae bacterium]